MARTIPPLSGWMTLLRPDGTTFPRAVATMSTCPKMAQINAMAKNTMIVPAMARPAGEAGVSMISREAGRNSRSSLARAGTGRRACNAPAISLYLLKSSLRAVEHRVSSTMAHQLVMRAVLYDPAMLDSDQPIDLPQGRETMSDDKNGAPGAHPAHVLLDDPLALIVERARRFIEDQYPRIG